VEVKERLAARIEVRDGEELAPRAEVAEQRLGLLPSTTRRRRLAAARAVMPRAFR